MSKQEVADSIRNRGESHKALFFQLFCMHTDAVKDGDLEKQQKFAKVLLETFDSASDDVSNLSIRIMNGE